MRRMLSAGLVGAALLAACTKDVILPGERFPVRAPLEDSVPVEGQPGPVAPPLQPANQSRPISLPAAVANADWSQRGGSAAHVSPHGQLSAAPQRLWSVAIGSGNSRRNRVAAAPVVAEGRIVTMDAQSLVQATSTAGAPLWRVDLTAEFDRGGEVSGGGLAAGAGRVFVATGYGELVALQADSGAVIWRQRLDVPAEGAPTVVGGTVFVMGRDGTGWAIEAATGKVGWQLPAAAAVGEMIGGAAPASDGNAVIFPFSSGLLVAVTAANGDALWVAPVAGERLGRAYAALGGVTGDPVISGGAVYAGTAGGRTAAVSLSTGDRLWTAEEGALNPPLVVGGSVFVVSDEARLVRLDAGSGEVIWSVPLPYYTKEKDRKRRAIFASFGPVLAGGHVVIVSEDGLVRLFNPTDGSLAGSAEIPGGAATAPALAGGVLYVVGANGQLHAFR